MSHPAHSPIPLEPFFELLQKNNPFTSNAAADPWFNSFPDVVSINRRAFEEILILIERKAADPRMPLAGMVLGEAGEGKTHLLRRILIACLKSKSPALFVFVKPLFHPKRPLHHLLQEIVLCLSKSGDGEDGFSQFERLVAEIMRDFVRYRVTECPLDATPNNRRFLDQFEADVFHIFTNGLKVHADSMEIIEKEAVRYIHSQVPETGKRFLDVIFQYKTPEKRGLVRDWLKGSVLDEEDCDILGVSSRAHLSDEAREQEAREMILTLGALFARYHLPMILCFDQLDNLIQPDLIAGFAGMIHLLVNDAANMLPLAFIRADSWSERFQKYPDSAFIHRMESNKLQLSGCTPDEAEELISQRIAQMLGEGTRESLVLETWLLPRLKPKLSAWNSPREVILFANRIIRHAAGESSAGLPAIAESLTAEYQSACEAVAVDFDAWDPESEYLKRAAELFLGNRENVLSCEPGENKYMTWTGTLKTSGDDRNGKEIPYACFINTAKNWQRVSATLDQCRTFLLKHPDGVCTYVSDARCVFSPTWKATIEKRGEVEILGGNIVILDRQAAVYWYGLVSLSLKIGSGDILLDGDHGLRTATDRDLANFLRMDFSDRESEAAFGRITTKR